MIYEYALDPALVATWHNRKEYLFFDEKFGINTRRIISIYPKKSKWQKMIWDVFQSSAYADNENARMRLSVLLEKLTEDACRRRSTYSEMVSWIERAEREHNERPFRAILTCVDGRANPAVVDVKKLIELGHELWTIPDLPMTPRRASEVADVIAPVLRVCRHVIIVDPYFAPDEQRFKRPFKAMIDKIFERRDGSEGLEIELHTGIERFFKGPYTPVRTEQSEKQKCCELSELCARHLRGIVPRGAKLTFVVWKERDKGQKLHNRYILTDIVSILLGAGLDECQDQDSETMDNIVLLPREQQSQCWKQYDRANPSFDYAGKPIEIVGQRT